MSTPKHHWLVSGNVIVTSKSGTRQRGLNTLIMTDKPVFTRVDIARAQEGLMRRIVSETAMTKHDKISDVFVIAVSNLGLMTEEEFEAGFVEALADTQAPAKEGLN